MEIYFPPYGSEEVKNILQARAVQGLYPGVLSGELLDLVVDQTMKTGDLRVGINLLKRSALSAERAARKTIEKEDICGAYEAAKYLHLSATLKTLKKEEKDLVRALAGMSKGDSEMNAGDVHKSLKEMLDIGYTRFYEMVKKLDAMRIINLHYRDGKGRTRLISLRYDPGKILEYLGPAEKN